MRIRTFVSIKHENTTMEQMVTQMKHAKIGMKMYIYRNDVCRIQVSGSLGGSVFRVPGSLGRSRLKGV